MTSRAICIVGSANTDYNFNVAEFPKEGETIQATNSYIANGGKGANQAVAAGRLLKDNVFFAGQMGQDEKAAGQEKELIASGVSLKYCRRLAGVDTGHAFIMINAKGENIIVIVGGANMHYDDLTTIPTEYKEAIDNSKIVLLQREIPNEINLLVAKYARQQGKVVILDFGGRDEPLPEGFLECVDIISPNDTELQRVIGTTEAVTEDMIRNQLLAKYPRINVLLKQGSKGCTLVTKDYSVSVGAANSYNEQAKTDYKILNTVGAGDCLTGAFAAAYYEKFLAGQAPADEQKAYKECLLFANTAAFLSCTKNGAMPSLPQRAEVDAYTQKYLADVKL